jgi:aspartate/methionine/tyrosine aminotransferase
MRWAAAREAAGGDTLHLEVGQPCTGSPAGALAAASAALARSAAGADALGYTSEAGIPALRRAIADMYAQRYRVAVPPSHVFATTGSSAAFVITFLACFDVGDRVALATPGYPCYTAILEALGVVPVLLPVDESTAFQPTVQMLADATAAGGPLKGVIVASPSNPTGTMLHPRELFALRDWCAAAGAWFISDEIYHRLTYTEMRDATAVEPSERGEASAADVAAAASVVELPAAADCAIVINSFSKYHSMTGARIGWCVVPAALHASVCALAQNLFISPPTLSQHAAAAAFGCDAELQGHLARYAANRAVLLRELPKAGLTRLAPSHGAFYIYADVSHLTSDSVALARRILDTTGVACTPGVDFDRARGGSTLRFSFCGAAATVEEAARRLVADGRWREPAAAAPP